MIRITYKKFDRVGTHDFTTEPQATRWAALLKLNHYQIVSIVDLEAETDPIKANRKDVANV